MAVGDSDARKRADARDATERERIEQAVDLRAGQAEYGIDAMRDETVDDCFPA